MIFTGSQLTFLQSKARFTFIKVKECIDQKEEWPVGVISAALQEAASMGHSIALDEVRSTPWEYLSDPILTDAARNNGHMNQLARGGWELQFVSSGWMFWRRRKAVAEIAAKEKPE
jgi:hypothetical protein